MNETADSLRRAAAIFPPIAAAAWLFSISHIQWGIIFAIFALLLWGLSWLARDVHDMIGQATAWRG